MKLNVLGIEIDGAVEGPNGLKVWPPQLLKKTLTEFEKRHSDIPTIKRQFVNKTKVKQAEYIPFSDFDAIEEEISKLLPTADGQ